MDIMEMETCPTSSGPDGCAEFCAQLFARSGADRLPLYAILELTANCNLRCGHCYHAGWNTQRTPAGHELSTSEWLAVIDELVLAGSLWVTFTGGEVLTRPDFVDIYLHAKRSGLLPIVFTNGTLLDARLADLLAEWPPLLIEISLYGANERTCEMVTGIPASYERCLRGVELIVARGLPLKLKTVVTRTNIHELNEIQALAESFNVPFRFDPEICVRLNGDPTPAEYRIPAQTVVQLDLEHQERAREWRRFVQRADGAPVDRERLFRCGAGRMSFLVDPCGRVSPCLMARQPSYRLGRTSFQEAWDMMGAAMDDMKRSKHSTCFDCSYLHVCGICPALAELETGDPEGAINFHCEITKGRVRAFGNDRSTRC
jgi:radical SAM protein with 4Fe4S-binding SPASM domain